MSTYTEILHRIQAVTKTRTQNELAALLGISQSSVSDSKKRQTIPAEWYLKLFERLGINPDWLKKGAGPMYLRTEAGYVAGDATGLELDPALLGSPLARPALATVYGGNEFSLDSQPDPSSCTPYKGLTPVAKIALPQSHVTPRTLVLAIGTDAAAPLVLRGAYAGFDAGQLQPGSVHAFLLPGEGLGLRRLFWDQARGGYVLRAENAAYPELHFTTNECRQRLLGKLAWVLQKVH